MKAVDQTQEEEFATISTSTAKYTNLTKEQTCFIARQEYGAVYKATREAAKPQTQTQKYPDASYVHIKQVTKTINVQAVKEEILSANAAISLNHPSLLPIIDKAADYSYYYLITPYCNKGALTGIITNGGIASEGEAIDYFRQICFAVKLLHSKNVMLKGLRTDDIWVNQTNGKSMMILADYGIARRTDENSSIAHTISILATRPPEMYTALKGYQTDLYSLGCILYKMLCKKEFNEGSTEKEIIANQKSLHERKIVCPWQLSDITLNVLEGLLQYDPNQRMSMAELSRSMDLEHLYENYKPIELDAKCSNATINTKSRRTAPEFASFDIGQPLQAHQANMAASYSSVPNKIVNQKEMAESNTKDTEITKLKQEIEQLRIFIASLKNKQDQHEIEISSFKSMMQTHKHHEQKGNSESDMIAELTEIKNPIKKSEPLPSDASKLQAQINSIMDTNSQKNAIYAKESKLTMEYIDKLKADIIEIKNVYNANFNKLNTQMSTVSQEASINSSKAVTDALESQKKEILEFRTSLLLVKNELVEANGKNTQAQVTQLHEVLSLNKTEISQIVADIAKMQTQFNVFNERTAIQFSKIANDIQSIEPIKSEMTIVKDAINSLTDAHITLANKQSQICKQETDEAKKPLDNANEDNDFAKLHLSIAQINDTLSQRKNEYQEVKTLTSESISKLQQQLNSIDEDIKKYKEAQKSSQLKDKEEANKLKEQRDSVDMPYSLEITKIQKQIEQISDILNQRNAAYAGESKSHLEMIESMKAEIGELKKHKLEAAPDENSKLQAQINSLLQHTDDYKLLSEMIEKNKAEIEKLKCSHALCSTEVSTQHTRLHDIFEEMLSKKMLPLSKEIKEIKESMNDTQKRDVTIVDSSLSLEIANLRSQIIQLQESNNPTAYNNQANEEVKTIITEIRGFHQKVELIKAEQCLYSTEISSLRAKVSEIQESISQKVESQLSIHNERLQTDMSDIRRSFVLRATEAPSAEITKINSQLYQLQESINQRITIYAKDVKALSDATTKLKIEMTEAKQGIAKEENIQAELIKIQSNVNQLLSKEDAQKQIIQEIALMSRESESLKSSISTILARLNSIDESQLNIKIEEIITKQANSESAIHKKEIEEINKALALIQSTIDQKMQLQSNADFQQYLQILNTQKGEIDDLKQSIVSLKTDTRSVDSVKLQTQIYKIQECVEQKLMLFSKDIREARLYIENIDNSSFAASISALQAELSTATSALSNIKEESNAASSKIQSIETGLASINASMQEMKTANLKMQPTIMLKTKAMIEEACSLSQPLINIPDEVSKTSTIKEIISRVAVLEDINKQLASPKKDTGAHFFKTAEKEIMKLELSENKFRIIDLNGVVKDEICINEISLLKLDDAAKCVVLTKKAALTPGKSYQDASAKAVSIKLFADMLQDAIDLFKFIRNAHLLKSDKKQLRLSSP